MKKCTTIYCKSQGKSGIIGERNIASMSGHSKWATIKRQKGANDQKRGALFTKLSKAITIAVQQGGGVGDPAQNFRLRLAVDSARASNMPKENIQRAIDRAAGKSGVTLEEVVYEGFAPGGVAIVVEAATDNKNRTTGEVQNVFNKNGGSVSYMIVQKGQIILPKNGKSVDDIFLDAADSGAEDIEDVGEEVFVYTNPTDLGKVRDALSQKEYQLSEMQIVRKPTMPAEVADDVAEKTMEFIEKLEDLDDVQNVYSTLV